MSVINSKFRKPALLLGALLTLPPCLAQPLTTHPRLFLRSTDLPRLRSWAVDSNPVYRDGLARLAAQARADMEAGRVPNQDIGAITYVDYPSEMYAELFAFLSLVSNDQAARDDYARRARILLMYVISRAAQGRADGQPFRDGEFSVNDRSRWHGESFALTVDWIYPYLTAPDKAAIRQVFLRWIDELRNAAVTGHDHPLPIGVVNDPVLTRDREQVRWAANNYFCAHMRNIGLMAMALDAADDPDNSLRGTLRNATGAWLYIIDYLMRNDSRGGLFPEGFEYSPQSLGYVAQFLLALRTAGQDDPAVHGPQVVLTNNPFWEDLLPAHVQSLSPAPAQVPDLGQVYQPAWYGDGLNYWAPDAIGLFGPLGLYDAATGRAARLQAVRWLQTHTAPGGADGLTARARDSNFFLNAILYFLLFDPAAPPPPDPRPAQPLMFFAPGIGRILARTGWGPDATWFTYKLGWIQIDHQTGDGNQFEFYRRGEWLTKERTGYDLNYGASPDHNTLALENSPPEHNAPDDYRHLLWRVGSQWTYSPSGDPQILARSLSDQFVYALGDATALYNSTYEGSVDILHASRSIVWLKPDHIVVYDRAASRQAGRFKRFWLNFPTQAAVTGNRATVTTASGQKLFVTTLLPAGASLRSEPAVQMAGDVAQQEPMGFQLRVEAPGGPQSARFLHVLQGADPGASADTVTLIQSTSGAAFQGALINNVLTLFPVDLSPAFGGVTYSVPSSVTVQRITGLTPYAGYRVVSQAAGSNLQWTISPTGGDRFADSGGVLELFSGAATPSITASGVVNAATLQAGAVAPGELISLFGSGLGPLTGVGAQLSAPGQVDKRLANVTVLFDGVAAPMLYARAGQVNAAVPYAIARRSSTVMRIVNAGVPSSPLTLPVVDSSPGLFALGGAGIGPGAILNQDSTLNSAANPAARGSVIVLYGTGGGETDPASVDGVLTAVVLARPRLPVAVTIGGRNAEVVYAGAAPGLIAGVLQVNVRILQDAASGPAVPVVVRVGTHSSPAGVTVAIQP